MADCVDLWNFWEEHQFGIPQGYVRTYKFTASLHHSRGLVEYLYSHSFSFKPPQALISFVSTYLDAGIATGNLGQSLDTPNRTIGIGVNGEITYYADFVGYSDPQLSPVARTSFQATCIALNIWTGSFDFATIHQQIAAPGKKPHHYPSDPTFMTITAKYWDDIAPTP
jgi:hypothetical protein